MAQSPRKSGARTRKRKTAGIRDSSDAPATAVAADVGEKALSHFGMERSTIPPALNDEDRRRGWGLPGATDEPGDYMIELNLSHARGIDGANEKLRSLFKKIFPSEQPVEVSKSYFSCRASLADLRRLVSLDERQAGTKRNELAIYKVWPDFPIRATLDRSVTTVKADAAVRSFAASGDGIVWAVVDSGIQADHDHFGQHRTLSHPNVSELHRDFTQTGEPVEGLSLRDEFGHGTHVAGIIAGRLEHAVEAPLQVFQKTYDTKDDGSATKVVKARELEPGTVMSGVAPLCRLVSLKVLGPNGAGKTSNVIRALTYIREKVNGDPKMLRIHGVNLSLGYEFDAEMFACGQSPLCVEVDRLVNCGVVVVASAGNTGYGRLNADQRATRVGLANTINDPGNAALAITVGSTHRDAPHTYGVSYFSSKGPTGDGRLKPDIVAPGERITSCAAGKSLAANGGTVPDGTRGYIDDSGTSQAAPHVSGAIAAFLSIRREFLLQPQRVKRIFMDSSTCLGRERYFQGSGLIDLMRAIQSV